MFTHQYSVFHSAHFFLSGPARQQGSRSPTWRSRRGHGGLANTGRPAQGRWRKLPRRSPAEPHHIEATSVALHSSYSSLVSAALTPASCPAQRGSCTGHGHCKQDPTGPSSCTLVLLRTLLAPKHHLLPFPPGIHRPLAPASRQCRRCVMAWGDAAGVRHGRREQDPAAPPVLRHLLQGTLAREQLQPFPPGHASPQSGLHRIQGGSVSMCVQRGSVDCRPHGRSREPGGTAAAPGCPGISRDIPQKGLEARSLRAQHLWCLPSGAACTIHKRVRAVSVRWQHLTAQNITMLEAI